MHYDCTLRCTVTKSKKLKLSHFKKIIMFAMLGIAHIQIIRMV